MVKLVRKKFVVSKREADFKRVANKEFSLLDYERPTMNGWGPRTRTETDSLIDRLSRPVPSSNPNGRENSMLAIVSPGA
jgi:hypothetical protein